MSVEAKMLIRKKLILALSVASVVGCGSSKDSKPVTVGGDIPPSTQTAPNPVTTQQAPAPMPTPAGSPSQQNRSIDRGGAQSTENDFQTDIDQKINGQSGQNQKPGQSNGWQTSYDSSEEQQTGTSNVLNPQVNLVDDGLHRAMRVTFAEAEAHKTGGQSVDGLFYTSSSDDGLMSEFKSYNNKVNAEQKQMNLNLAKGIVAAQIKRQLNDNSIQLHLTVDEFGKLKTYVLKANQEDNRFRLTLVSKTGDLEYQGGFLKCTDTDGGCENAYAKIKLTGAYARIIFRSSYASRMFHLPSTNTSKAFSLWQTYVGNTVDSVKGTTQAISYVQISSFEVVNGRSAMGLLLVTDDKQLVGLSIPLLAQAKGTVVDVPVQKVTDLSLNYDLKKLAGTYSTKLSDTLKSIRLERNNGLGDIRLKMDVSDSTNDLQKSFIWMTVSKMNKSTLSVDQVQEFEKTVKAF